MHTNEALEDGVEQSVLNMLPVWREAKAFSPRERTALSWAETLTSLAGSGVSDEDFESAREEFTEQELAALTIAVGTMNLWNRVGVGANMTA
jgi:alkylhydroperoxidase family enzyme